MQSTFRLRGDSFTTGSIETGTAFFIGRPSKKTPRQSYFVLVTAAHVLEDIKGDDAQLILRKVNKQDWSYEKVPYPIKIRQNGKPLWTRHDDKDVDIAVMYVPFTQKDVEILEITLLPMDYLADEKLLVTIGIHPGDELMCLGYPFSQGWGSGDFPILRSGKIASALLPIKNNKVFLYDFEVFKGNSGGPVYMSEALRSITFKERDKTFISIKPVNIIIGIVIEEGVLIVKTETPYEKKENTIPLKLAKVVHASLIRETIEKLPELP